MLVPPKDGDVKGSAGVGNVLGTAGAAASLDALLPRYRVKTRDGGWLAWMEGLACVDGCGDDFAGVTGEPIVGLEVDWRDGGGWFALFTADCPGGLARNCAGDGSPVVGVTCYYETQDPDMTGWLKAKYRVAPVGGGFFKWEYDDEDDFAGDGESPIDRFQLTLERT